MLGIIGSGISRPFVELLMLEARQALAVTQTETPTVQGLLNPQAWHLLPSSELPQHLCFTSLLAPRGNPMPRARMSHCP